MTSFDLTLYLVTDRRMPKEGFETVVEEAIRGGVTLVQLREKEGDTGLLYERARRLKKVTDRYHIPLIIDDRIDIMLAVDAAGVHVGQSDMPAAIARQMIGPDKILGVSAANLTDDAETNAEAEAEPEQGNGGAAAQNGAADFPAPSAQEFTGSIDRSWHRHSFSSVTHNSRSGPSRCFSARRTRGSPSWPA